MIRKKNIYLRPRKRFDKARIEEENALVEKYGLKNKKEIWKADATIAKIRNLAKGLITKSEQEKIAFIEKLQKQGFNINSLSDVLGLNKEDLLKRRLQTIVYLKKFALSPKQSRQLITHKHISIKGNIVNIPSYKVSLDEETEIELDIALKINKPKKSQIEEIKEEVLEGIEA